jgi:hypothetical protein
MMHGTDSEKSSYGFETHLVRKGSDSDVAIDSECVSAAATLSKPTFTSRLCKLATASRGSA